MIIRCLICRYGFDWLCVGVCRSNMSYDLNCLFCKIVVGEILSMKVYEDDEFVVFCDICLVVDMYVFVILC